jgi:hypothetical protein
MSLYHGAAQTYLGPAAEQFIARQCRAYLKIEPDALNKQHLTELTKWVEVGGMRFMDEAKSKELASKIARAALGR